LIGALIRDTIYIVGGELAWQRTYKDGSTELYTGSSLPYCIIGFSADTPGRATDDQSVIYQINLTHPFTSDDSIKNASRIFTTLDKPNSALQVQNGHMLANDYEFILYGGLMADSDSVTYPGQDWALARDILQHDPVPLRKVEWRNITLPSRVTRYVGGGAYVSAPSEDLAWVFGGSRVRLSQAACPLTGTDGIAY